MAISDNRSAPTRQFGRGNAQQQSTSGSSSDKPKAQIWMNIGVTKTIHKDEGDVEEFISLPMGMPIDTMETKPATSRNEDFRNRELGQNALLKQVLAKAAQLAPGEDCIINLQVQLRRVNADVTPTDDDDNQYVVNVEL